MRIIGLNVAAILNPMLSLSLVSLSLAMTAMTASAQPASSQGEGEQPLPVVKLSPTVRSEAIDPYADLPCKELGTVSPETEAEREALVAASRSARSNRFASSSASRFSIFWFTYSRVTSEEPLHSSSKCPTAWATTEE